MAKSMASDSMATATSWLIILFNEIKLWHLKK